MDLRVFTQNELVVVLRALRRVAIINDRFTDAERALVEGVAQMHGLTIDADALEPISFEEVAAVVVAPHRRKRAIQLAMVTSLVEGVPSAETTAAVREFAKALAIDEAGLDVIYQLTYGQAFSARLDMIRRVSRFIRNADGFPGIFKMALPFLGISSDLELAARYRSLELCPPGSIGRAVYDHFVDNGFKFPGEPGGIAMIFHDLGHVLSGYGTDPQSEIEQAAFQAGFARQDGFTFLLFGILQFHLGLRITPVAKGYKGLFDVPRVLAALQRGASCKVDVSQGYDLFENKNRSLSEIREELGIPPLDAAA